MNIAPLGILGAAAGTGMSQRAGSEPDRAKQEAIGQQRQTELAQQAENAAGVGETSEDQQAEERDADGRRPWEIEAQGKSPDDAADEADGAPPRPRDPSGQRGSQLDLTG